MQVSKTVIDTLHVHPNNPRKGNIDLIAESLQANGQYRPITVQESTRYVLAGNHTMLAAQSLGWDTIDAVFVDVDDTTATRILLADNRTSDLGGYDAESLLVLLRDLDVFDGTGYNEADYEALAHLWDTPTDLDDLADEYGDMGDEDLMVKLNIRITRDTMEKWRARRAAADTDEALLRSLLG